MRVAHAPSRVLQFTCKEKTFSNRKSQGSVIPSEDAADKRARCFSARARRVRVEGPCVIWDNLSDERNPRAPLATGCMHSLTTPYNKAHHRFAALVAFATFLLLIAGALVTSNDAGLAVPDWPTSFNHWPVTYSYFTVPMVGGVRWEHGHRILAQIIGILTIVLAVWTSKVDRRPWMRKLGWAALATVIAQGILGGVTVLNFLPPSISSAHATLAQTFFCLVVSLWLFTGRTWVQ